MNRLIAAVLASLTAIAMHSAEVERYQYNEYYYQRSSLFEVMPIANTDIVFVGNSLTNGGRWHEMFGDNLRVKNRGIISDVVQGIADRIKPVTDGHPQKIFLLVGINDISHHLTADSIATAVENLVATIRRDAPSSTLYLQSMLPINNDFHRYRNLIGTETEVLKTNVLLEQVARRHGVQWVNLFPAFADRECKLIKSFTSDGLHLNSDGYRVWRREVARYVGLDIDADAAPLSQIKPSDIVLLGNSLVSGAEWHELAANAAVKSRTVGSDAVDYLPKLAASVANHHPKRVVLLPSYVANADAASRMALVPDSIVSAMTRAIDAIKVASPQTEIVLQGMMPVNGAYEKYATLVDAKAMKSLNGKLKKLARRNGVAWVDLMATFADSTSELKPEFTNDGFHLMGCGYAAWAALLSPYLK